MILVRLSNKTLPVTCISFASQLALLFKAGRAEVAAETSELLTPSPFMLIFVIEELVVVP